MLPLVAGLAVHGATIFSDNFSAGSTLDSVSPAAPTATATAYQLVSSKKRTPQPAIGADNLKFGIAATSSGSIEVQARFAATPVALEHVHDYLELTVVFTNTTGLFAQPGMVGFGLYNSGGMSPLAGGLNGTANASTNVVGGAQNWQGYAAHLAFEGGYNRIVTRPAQTIIMANNQDLVTEGSPNMGYRGGTNLVSKASKLSLASGTLLTETFRITLTAPNQYQIDSKLYAGGDATGDALVSQTAAAKGDTFLTGSFDALAVGWRVRSETTPSSIAIRSLTVNQGTVP